MSFAAERLSAGNAGAFLNIVPLLGKLWHEDIVRMQCSDLTEQRPLEIQVLDRESLQSVAATLCHLPWTLNVLL